VKALEFKATLSSVGRDSPKGRDRAVFTVSLGPNRATHLLVHVTEAVARELAAHVYDDGAFIVRVERAQRVAESDELEGGAR
jgi:hypothetical protein